MSYLEEYLAIRRIGWPYEDSYEVNPFGEHGFVAKVEGNVAGLAWADVIDASAVIHMNLKSQYAEYGIGTELLHILMDHLKNMGILTIRYTISKEHWAYQIYDNLGFRIEKQDMDNIYFIWEDMIKSFKIDTKKAPSI